MSDRVKIIGGPWPERIGCTATIVYPINDHDAHIYPFRDRTRNDVVVKIDNDPLVCTDPKHDFCDKGDQRYSCIMRRQWVRPLG